jgi:hypothetical protein
MCWSHRSSMYMHCSKLHCLALTNFAADVICRITQRSYVPGNTPILGQIGIIASLISLILQLFFWYASSYSRLSIWRPFSPCLGCSFARQADWNRGQSQSKTSQVFWGGKSASSAGGGQAAASKSFAKDTATKAGRGGRRGRAALGPSVQDVVTNKHKSHDRVEAHK